MKIEKYYILKWHDEGETNRAETIWEGKDAKEARRRFNAEIPTKEAWCIEAYAMTTEGDEYKLEQKYI